MSIKAVRSVLVVFDEAEARKAAPSIRFAGKPGIAAFWQAEADRAELAKASWGEDFLAALDARRLQRDAGARGDADAARRLSAIAGRLDASSAEYLAIATAEGAFDT